MARTLIKAILSGQETLAKDIIQRGHYGGNDNQTSKTVGKALIFCCSRGLLELAKLLLDKGASVASTDKNRATPLHGAVDNGYLNIVRLLINQGANVNAQNFRGDTPLHLAAYRGYGEITQCLIEAGADSRLVNANSFNAENEAFLHGHRDVGEYLRSENKARYSSLTENSQPSFDSMIKLERPLPVCQNKSENEQEHKYQRRKEHHLNIGHQIQNRKSDYGFSYKSYTDKRNDLSFIALEPPESLCPDFCSLDQQTNLSEIHFTTKAPSSPLNSTPNRLPPQETLKSYQFPLTVEVPALKTSAVSTSKALWSTPSVLTQRPLSASPQPGDILFREDTPRRPSTSSTCSCFSDIHFSTGSDALSSLSSGSDASDSFWDSRLDDIDSHDNKLVNTCQENQDEDMMWLSLGVRNPPSANKYKTQISAPPEAPRSSAIFTDFYDSTLFSLTFRRKESTSTSCSRNVKSSEGGNDCSEPGYMGIDYRCQMERTSSKNYARCEPHTMQKVCYYLDKNNSAYVKSSACNLDTADIKVSSGFDRMSSNDLSSPFLLSENSVNSLTSVNIPLN